MKTKCLKYITLVILQLTFFSSCQKDWLNIKPQSNTVVVNTPTNTIADYQNVINIAIAGYGEPNIGEYGSDDFYCTKAYLTSIGMYLPYYIWAPTGYQAQSEGSWTLGYRNIFACNTAIDGLNKINKTSSNTASWNLVYGSALFIRALNYFQLSQAFMKPYNSSTSNTDLGVPLRLIPDITQKVGRGTMQQVYDQIFADLNQAIGLLPVSSSQLLNPSQGAVYALLARIYLSMGDYKNALANASKALQINAVLLDYNSLNPNTSPTFPTFDSNQNPEIYIVESFAERTLVQSGRADVDSILYKSYDNNDLRKTCFFTAATDGGHTFYQKLTYTGYTNLFFLAPAVDEMYLTRAECYARQGDTKDAMTDLNTLLVKRWKTGTFVNLTATSADDALSQILTERRKELVMRDTRWTDLRRLNQDPKFAVTITRVYNGQTYTLAPGSNLYVWPIPQDEILYSGIPDNPR